MINCVHLIPADGLGGVEAAARSYLESQVVERSLELKVMYLAGRPGSKVAGEAKALVSPFPSINNPLNHLWALLKLLQQAPEVLVCSLWRTMPVGILYKLLRPRAKLVCFLHSTGNVHLADTVCNNVAMLFSSAIWTDCSRTLQHRIPPWLRARKKGRVISFLLRRFSPDRLPGNAPVFVFWGRLDHQKGVDRSLRLFARIAVVHDEAEFFIYGPDGGYAAELRSLAAELGIAEKVRFPGATTFDEIRSISTRFSYYLQMSRLEGMALSVVEAMQLGLPPIVTAVGEIPNYCHGGNALVFDGEMGDYGAQAAEVLAVLGDDQRYRRLQQEAIATWENVPTYDADIIRSLKELCEQ